MDRPFELPVMYNEKELMLPAQLLKYGYTHKVKVNVNGLDVFFEPDEEGNYRSYIDPSLLEDKVKIRIELLMAITQSIETIMK